MKSAVLLTALLVGLCATGSATLLLPEIHVDSEVFDSLPFLSPFAIYMDPGPAENLFFVDDLAAADTGQNFNPAMTFRHPLAAKAFFASFDSFNSVRVPEPAPFSSLLVAAPWLGILGLYKLNYRPRKRRSNRYRRPLTVLR